MREEKEPATLRPDDDAMHVAMIASAVADELGRRYGLSAQDVAEATRWVQEHRQFIAKMQHSSYLTLVGTLIGACLLVAWEGVKAYLRKAIT